MAGQTKKSIYGTWNEIDNAIRHLGDLDIQKAQCDSAMTREINSIKEKYTPRAQMIKQEQARLKTEIERFCNQNKDGFLKQRHKKLNYGIVAYRVSESVKYNRAEECIIESLKALNLTRVLKVKEKIDKDKLKELDKTTLIKLGVEVVKKDGLAIVPDVAKIAGGEGVLDD